MKKITVLLVSFALAAFLPFVPVSANDTNRAAPVYENPKDIIITHPDNMTVTQSSKISILGACDSEAPIYMNGGEIKTTDRGFFSLYVTLKDGENNFVFRNNGKMRTVTIFRSAADELMYPAPKFGVINRANVTHKARPDDDPNILTPLAKGTVLNITGEAGNYYRTEFNTYVFKEVVDLLPDAPPPNVIVSSVIEDVGNISRLRLGMKVNAFYDLEVSDNKALLSIHAFEDKSALSAGKSARVSQTSKSITEGKAVYELFFTEEPIGSCAEFKNGEMIVSFVFAKRSDGSSLSGRKVVLDAGHGGDDLGALGPLGIKGASEKDYNLYVTLAAAEYLKSRGAEVILSRSGDTFIDLQDRVSLILEKKPDLSVSIHTNSMPVTHDFNNTRGARMYYTFSTGQEAAESIHKRAAAALKTTYTPPNKDNFALTRITNCPAILFEMGFMSNPFDYEWLLDGDNLEMMGRALGESIEGYLTEIE